MVEVVETVEVERDSEVDPEEGDSQPPKAIGHFGWGSGTKIALCGAPLLGIKAFGDFELCWRCAELRKEYFPEWSAQGAPF